MFFVKTYRAPEKNIEYANIIEFIDELPEDDDPSIFGMNIYAQKMLLASRGEHLISSILSMEPMKNTNVIGDTARIK